MSAPLENKAGEIQTRAADWVNQHRDSGTWSDEDQAALDAWLAQSPEHVVAYWRLDAAWERTQRLAALRPSAPGRSRSLIWRNLIRFAAAIIVVAAGTGAAFYFSKPAAPDVRNFATEVGARKTIKLADGSEIELNTNSSLRIAPGPNPRMAWLDKGEAYFRIQHDSAHPFVVMAQGRRVVDLGTEFLMKSEPKRLEVALVAGRAQLDSPNDPMQEPAVLTPGDVAIATATAISVTAKSSKTLADTLSWRQGVLVFKYTTLADAAAEFNRYNTKKIVIADP
ncbi:MAG TPA: FecR domain-containing protein, partial [Rhizomicrobium sp.]